jgi:ketosteroid isomerase-like protein
MLFKRPLQEDNHVANLQEVIEAQNREFMAAFKRKDGAGVAALYTGDARILPPNSPMLTGRDQIEQFWKGLIQMGGENAVLETLSVESKGDVAVEVGKYSLSVGTFNDSGKYVVVWKNDEGTWRLHLDVWNTSLPAA